MKLFSINSAAKEIGISRHTLAKYVEQGLIEIIQFPQDKRPRIAPAALAAFIERYTIGHAVGHTDETEPVQIAPKQATLRRGRKTEKQAKPLWFQKYA